MIRAYRHDDTEQVIQVWLDSTIPGQAFLPEDHWRAMEPEIRALLTEAETWVVDREGEIVAFMATLGSTIGGLFTLPGHQGKGHGRRLIEHARERFDPVLVEVFEANHQAIGFYRSCGFAEHARKTDPGSELPVLILKAGRPMSNNNQT